MPPRGGGDGVWRFAVFVTVRPELGTPSRRSATRKAATMLLNARVNRRSSPGVCGVKASSGPCSGRKSRVSRCKRHFLPEMAQRSIRRIHPAARGSARRALDTPRSRSRRAPRKGGPDRKTAAGDEASKPCGLRSSARRIGSWRPQECNERQFRLRSPGAKLAPHQRFRNWTSARAVWDATLRPRPMTRRADSDVFDTRWPPKARPRQTLHKGYAQGPLVSQSG